VGWGDIGDADHVEQAHPGFVADALGRASFGKAGHGIILNVLVRN
jgi:hypothetical protein